MKTNTIENPITLTENQQEAVQKIVAFVQSENDIFILTGAAGTGKTTVVKNIIASSNAHVQQVILLAPTNRAVKVLSNKTGILATTVHSEIYTIKEVKNDDGVVLYNLLVPRIGAISFDEDLEVLRSQKRLFIVDESSMLSATANTDGALISNKSLLEDLYDYVKFLNPHNKLLFVGDSYQLPPIGHEGIAPALDIDYVAANYSKGVVQFELSTILRQSSDSYIINLAQAIKEKIDRNVATYNVQVPNTLVNYQEFIKDFVNKFDDSDTDKTIALGWTRKNVLKMNLDIRKELYGANAKEIEVGDLLYVNSKHVIGLTEIPKGEIGKIVEVVKRDGIKGELLFHTVKIEFTGMDSLPYFVTTKILTDYLYAEADFMSKELFIKLAIERSGENEVYKKSKDAKDDFYMNALQAKFAYALTVHKSQGGEWENVYLHAVTNWRDLRWSYTAVTRAAKELYSHYR